MPAHTLSNDARFFAHLKRVNVTPKNVASHLGIEKFIQMFGKDYRYEIAPHPIAELQNRENDNVTAGTV